MIIDPAVACTQRPRGTRDDKQLPSDDGLTVRVIDMECSTRWPSLW